MLGPDRDLRQSNLIEISKPRFEPRDKGKAGAPQSVMTPARKPLGDVTNVSPCGTFEIVEAMEWLGGYCGPCLDQRFQ